MENMTNLETTAVLVDEAADAVLLMAEAEETVVEGEDIHTLHLLGVDKAQDELKQKNDTKYKLYDCYLNGNTEEFRSYYSNICIKKIERKIDFGLY